MEKNSEIEINNVDLDQEYYKPIYHVLFNKIKNIRTPVKNDIIVALLDGNWHSERDIIRIAKRQKHSYMGAVTLGTMISSLNHMLSSNYVEKKIADGELYYKISDNYVGLTRAAYTKYYFSI